MLCFCEEAVYEPCMVCGSGKMLDPEKLRLPISGGSGLTITPSCEDLQTLGKRGGIHPDTCTAIGMHVHEACGYGYHCN